MLYDDWAADLIGINMNRSQNCDRWPDENEVEELVAGTLGATSCEEGFWVEDATQCEAAAATLGSTQRSDAEILVWLPNLNSMSRNRKHLPHWLERWTCIMLGRRYREVEVHHQSNM